MLSQRLVFSFLLITSINLAQANWQETFDSLKVQLDTIQDDSTKIEKLFEIGDLLLKNVPLVSFEYFQQAKEIASRNNDTTHIVPGILRLCKYYMMVSEYSYVLETAYEALEKSGDNLAFKSDSHEQISEGYSFLEDYDEAIKHVRITLDLKTQLKDTSGIANAMHLIGVNYLEIDEMDSALLYLYQAKDLNIALTGKPDPFDLSHIGHTYTYMDQFDSALYYHFQAFYYDSLADKNYDMAIDEYYIGFAYYRNEKYAKAINYINRSINRSNQLGLFEVMQYNYFVLAEIYAKQKDYMQAYEYALLRNDYADTLREKSNQSLVQSLEAKYRFKDQERQIATAEAENILLEKQSRLLIILIIVSLLLLASTIVIIFQIDKRNRANRRLLKAVEEADQAKEKIINVISHDLRGSIGTLRNAVKYTLDDTLDFDSIKNMMKSFYPVVDSTYDMLENLLTWARYNKEKLVPNFEQLNIKELCNTSLMHISPMVESKGISIINNAESLNIEADKSMLLTVFRNLISNAVKFSHTNSKVSIDCNSTSSSLEVQIKDYGIGIPEKILNKLFEAPLNYIHTKGTLGERGSGLGLAMCKDFIEFHQGKIWVKSVEGKGSTFHIYLPLHQNHR